MELGGSGWACLWQAGADLGKVPLHNPPWDSEAWLGSDHPWKVSDILGSDLSVAVCSLWSWQNLQIRFALL